jgi:putative transposase
MPTKNIVRAFAPNALYHVYNRGWNLGKIFLSGEDYLYFEKLLARHLSSTPVVDPDGREYRHFYPEVHLVAYCLMGNHFHMLFYQYDETAITRLMRSLMTAYTAYFNAKYKRRGSLFESRFKAVWVGNDAQLMHITRYIHLNHAKYATWRHSSYGDYLETPRSWIDTESILALFSSKEQYCEFVADYEEMQRERDAIKSKLYGRER